MFSVGHFASVADAIAATQDALDLQPWAVEMIDRTILSLSRSKLEYRKLAERLQGDPGALLFVSFAGDSDDAVRGKLDALAAAWAEHGHGYHTLRAETAAEQNELTKVRKAGLGLLMASSEGRRRPAAFVEDTAVAPERLGPYVERFAQILDRHGLEAGFYGHCSVGCLHIRPFIDLSEDVATFRAVAEEIKDLVHEFDGVNSSEHGDGRVRSEFNERIFGPELYGAMRRIKGIFDPENRLNPGVMVDPDPMTVNLRDASLPKAPNPLVTHLDFGEGGMYAAADRCQRIGACRKTGQGVMCPSYMATREEEHATRGRANALVHALSQPDPAKAMGDERLHEILDLCLECKACKSECPLSVDMASMKAEFLSHYNAIHGTPLRSRVFASIRTLNRLGSAFAPLSNLPAPTGLLGITNKRPRPVFERENLIRWNRKRARRGTGKPVVFLADSFTTFTESGVGRASIELLTAAGYDVRLEHGGCCGRASISKGLLDDAREKAESLTERLLRTEGPITGCEPSCLMTLREEHVQLLGDRGIAQRTRLVEELLLDADLPLRNDTPQRIVFHGHCHQKALAGTASTVELLERIPNTEVVELDAGCCGMAGSFGFESEHYDLSMRIGGMRLFPAVRREPAETLIAATGVSCRQQIHHGTGRPARHPVQIVRDALM
jgi:Fe-S oxidoreductase